MFLSKYETYSVLSELRHNYHPGDLAGGNVDNEVERFQSGFRSDTNPLKFTLHRNHLRERTGVVLAAP